MATEHNYGFSATSENDANAGIQRGIEVCRQEIFADGGVPDWTTLKVVKKDLATGWPDMPTVTAYGVLLSSLDGSA